MKKTLILLFLAATYFGACKKSETPEKDSSSAVIKDDTSQYNGRLYVYTYEYSNGTKIGSADTYLFLNYDDIKRGIYLYKIISGSSSAEADFGYLLQGNYYVVASKNLKADTSLVQVLGNQRINKKNVYLK